MSPEQGDRSTCRPCRGTGRVVSTLGGERHEVGCPWCGGSGRFQPGRDAQEEGPTDPAAGERAAPDSPQDSPAQQQGP